MVSNQTIFCHQEHSETTISMTIVDDAVIEVSGELIISLEPDIGYTVDAINSAVQVQIFDNDIPSGISILPVLEWVEEGEELPFSINLNPPLTTPQAIQLKISETGDYLGNSTISSIQIEPQVNTFEFDLATVEDDFRELDGEVTVELLAGTGYSLAESNISATVAILDNEQAAGVAILPLKPLISEGEVAEFQISTSEPLAIDTQINFELIAVGNFLPIEIPKSVIVQANTTSCHLINTNGRRFSL